MCLKIAPVFVQVTRWKPRPSVTTGHALNRKRNTWRTKELRVLVLYAENVDEMTTDESMFVRTVLALNDSFKSEDSSLALPSEERLARAADADADADGEQRRSRVEQQVQQLTLSRKAKRSTLKGRSRGAHPGGRFHCSPSHCHSSYTWICISWRRH